jgi:1,2-diacylglycerol 3-alpha-glucosyltransferase
VRIGIFTDDFLPRDSGVITSVIELRNGLTQLGHEVYIIAPRHPGYIDEDPGVIRLPSINPRIFHKARVAVPRAEYIRRIAGLKLDIVHSVTQFNTGIFADYMARKLGIPHVTTAHTIFAELLRYYPKQGLIGYVVYTRLYQMYFGERIKFSLPEMEDFITPQPKSISLMKRQIWNMQNMFLNNVDLVVSPSRRMDERLAKFGMKTPSVVIPNGIDTRFYDRKRTRKFVSDGILKVITVGRLSSEKRQDCIIRAIAKTKNTELAIVGDGPALRDYRSLVRDLRIEDRVVFHGSQDHAYIRDICLNSDVFAQASYNFDTQGIVLLEAAACGLPSIYCDPNLSDTVSPTGSRFTGRHPQDFSQTFMEILNNPTELKPMGAAAKKFAARHGYVDFARKSVEQYSRLIHN